MSSNADYSGEFTLSELDSAIQDLKTKKAPGFDNLFTEFIKHFDVETRRWILAFFNLNLTTSVEGKNYNSAETRQRRN